MFVVPQRASAVSLSGGINHQDYPKPPMEHMRVDELGEDMVATVDNITEMWSILRAAVIYSPSKITSWDACPE